MKYSLDDTIVAISTPVGEGGIGIVRLNGKDALSIADKIFKPKDGKFPSQFKSYTTHYGHIIDRERYRGLASILDEVILTVMRAPGSYTKEDIVEINCHGGITPLRRVLELVLSLGARLAEPGEFTKRAYLNGRIDLTQAESVLDIIRSKTDISLHTAMSQLEGELSGEIRNLRNELLDLSSHVEASIDFPDEDIEILTTCDFKARVERIIERLKNLITSADKGKVLTEDVNVVISGSPNVGKSSLMNALLKEGRVIVSHIPGTTRDTIEEIVNINGIPLKIIDTAGIIEEGDILVKEGVKRSRFHIKAADVILLVLDGSRPLGDSDMAIIDEIKDRKVIVIINKIDLPERLELDKIRDIFRGKNIIEISATKKINLKELEDAISEMVWGGEVVRDHTVMITNARHKALLIQARDVLERALGNHGDRVSPEFIALDLKEATKALSEITGETIDTDILDKIFSNFCIGK